MVNAEEGTPIDYFRCFDRFAHTWAYLGQKAQLYRCTRCAITVTKQKLKEETDA